MSTVTISRYQADQSQDWDGFVEKSKNGTFLFQRAYMDYHQDRFTDHSLLFFDDSRLVALLPACQEEQELVSHGGLTYGGMVTDSRMTQELVLDLFNELGDYLRENRFRSLLYKAIPHIYHTAPAEEDLYALFRQDAKLFRRDASSTIRMANRLKFWSSRRQGISRAEKGDVLVRESSDYKPFMTILEQVLRAKHDLSPVHSLEEMELLAERFPAAIKLFVAECGGELLAGTIIYETPMVAHTQYIASTLEGRDRFGPEALFGHLLSEVYAEKPYFDFGISTEQAGQILNQGLAANKESWGARTTVYDQYRWTL